MKVAQISRPGGPIEIVERPIPEPGSGQVLLRVEACGLCHSDSLTKEGHWPGIQYPRVPGHEIAGVIHQLGQNTGPWKTGQRVGVGWHGGHCTFCKACRRGKFVSCELLQIPGIGYDGGYAEYMLTPAQGLASIPDILKAEEAGPVLCAGVTTFNALRHSGALAGDLVAVQGLGGLGHLGVQFANKLGFETVAIGRGQDKREMVLKLGAHHYIDTEREQPAKTLSKLGGAKTILATAGCEIHDLADRRIGNERRFTCRGRESGLLASHSDPVDHAKPRSAGLGFRRLKRFRRRSPLLRILGSASDD